MKPGRGWRKPGVGSITDWFITEGLRNLDSEEGSDLGKDIPGRRDRKCKGPEAGMC